MEVVEDLDLGSQSQCREVDGVLEAGLEEAWLQIWPGVQAGLGPGEWGRNHGNATDSGTKRPMNDPRLCYLAAGRDFRQVF